MLLILFFKMFRNVFQHQFGYTDTNRGKIVFLQASNTVSAQNWQKGLTSEETKLRGYKWTSEEKKGEEVTLIGPEFSLC